MPCRALEAAGVCSATRQRQSWLLHSRVSRSGVADQVGERRGEAGAGGRALRSFA